MAPRERRQPLDSSDPTGSLPNSHLAAVLSEIADLLEIKGESSFKVGAYRRAADSVARSGVEVAQAYREGDPPRLRGVGASISERIRRSVVRLHPASLGITEPVTVSVGVAVAGPGGLPVDRLVERADGALYRAKRQGRDRVVTA